MKYKEFYKGSGVLKTKVYKEQLSEIDDIKKGKIRQRIEQEVFDLHDSVADNSKMIFLLATMIRWLYNADFNKNNLTQEQRDMIENALELYHNTPTRMDLQYQQEGFNLIQKLLQRQGNIATIIQEEYNE